MKTIELTGAALDWAVAKCEGWGCYPGMEAQRLPKHFKPSTDWSQGGPIIEREGISIIKLEHEYGVDSKGYTTSKRIPVFGAVIGKHFDADQLRNSYGESWFDIYYIEEALVTTGPTPLIAAMRCYVASKLGADVDEPKEIK